MRAAPGLHIEWVDEEGVVLDPATGKIHYLNPTAALFFALVLEHGYDSAISQIRKKHRIRFRRKKELRALIDAMSDKGLLIDE